MRVRPPACTTLMRRRSPPPTSCTLRPSALVVFGKSNAMRGGLFAVNPAGGFAGASLSVTLTIILPACCGETLTASMLLACAHAETLAAAMINARTARQARDITRDISSGESFIFWPPVHPAAAPAPFLPRCRYCPEQFL